MSRQDHLTAADLTAPVLIELVETATARTAIITLNRPAERNPIDSATLATLERFIADLAHQPPTAIIITGEGEAFSAGGDLKSYQELYGSPSSFEAFLRSFSRVCEGLESSGSLTIAMVNGTCVAGGLELALACDLIVMSDKARIGDGHLRFSQIPGAGGSQRLVRAIGHQRARQWLLTGDLFDPDVAFRIGLAAEVVPHDQLRGRTMEIIDNLAIASPLARSQMKHLLRLSGLGSFEEALEQEAQITFRYATESHDAREGLRAFAEKRPGVYLGE